MNASHHSHHSHHRHRRRRHSWQRELYSNVLSAPSAAQPAVPVVARPTVTAAPATPKPSFPIVLLPPAAPHLRRHLGHDGPGIGLMLLMLALIVAAAVGFMYWVSDDTPQPVAHDAIDFDHPGHTADFDHPIQQR